MFNKENAWEIYWKKHGEAKGLFYFARVGFNPGKSKAVVYYEWHGGYLCAEGYYCYLEKKDGIWKIIRRQRGWRS